ncbi:tetratricopeptide repeat protein [Ancylobacter terrae]|uniref:tetratricopeptide repeat protein n=1 Tax=Ancylobacter sp. sgz301288 TaxID=3342077 RepID=UPI00385F2B81
MSIRPAAALLAAVVAVTGSAPAFAQLPSAAAPPSPVSGRLATVSPAGNYLAAHFATSERDNVAAATYYRALVRIFPRNGAILEPAFLTVLSEGSVDEAADLAERIVKIAPDHRLARLVLGVQALRQKQYATARRNLRVAGQGAVGNLAAAIMIGWSQFGSDNTKGAVDGIDSLQGPDWYAGFKDLHAGLILDAAGQRKAAGRRLEEALKIDSRTLRVVDAYARWASRSGDKKLALATYESFDKVLPNNPLVEQSVATLESGGTLQPLVRTPAQGAAEILYGLGAELGRQGGEDLALIYLQLARWLDPSHALIDITLADLLENMKKHDEAIAVLVQVPDSSPLKSAADIQRAMNLDAASRSDEAKAVLKAVIEKNPKDLRAITALGDVQRSKQEYADAAATYTRAIDQLQAPTAANWTLYYFRGTAYERTKEWAKSEADLKKALELKPDQPHVLNYLGYSWIDQGINLDDGMEMIRKAVTLRPDDGYFIDSLGWAYYRTGHYDDAVRELERAVELKPEESVINDHLGDAYWKVGRKLEAQFQWNHARDQNPEPDDLAKIQRKIAVGLDEAQKASAEITPPATGKPGGG